MAITDIINNAKIAENNNDWTEAARLWRSIGYIEDAQACELLAESTRKGNAYRNTFKIITLIRDTDTIDVNREFRSYKYAIPERPPVLLSTGQWLHIYRVTQYTFEEDTYGDTDYEQEILNDQI